MNAPGTTESYFSVAGRPKFLVWLGHYLLDRPLAAFLAAARQPGITRIVSQP
ncbi:MAG TPA: hypothetical protein VII54_11345 [Gaiellaceae bacterium]